MPQASYRRERDYTNDFNWMYELKVMYINVMLKPAMIKALDI